MAEDRFERELLRGSLDMLVLSTLVDEPKYGYLIQKRMEQASGGRVGLPAGTLYPLLHRLESERLIKSQWDETTGRRRKWYRLTPKGQTRLQRQRSQWEQFAACVQALLKVVPSPKTT